MERECRGCLRALVLSVGAQPWGIFRHVSARGYSRIRVEVCDFGPELVLVTAVLMSFARGARCGARV